MKLTTSTTYTEERTLPSGITVTVHQVPGTLNLEYMAWEPDAAWAPGHGTQMHVAGQSCGHVASRRVPAPLSLDAWGSKDFRAECRDEAVVAIVQAFGANLRHGALRFVQGRAIQTVPEDTEL